MNSFLQNIATDLLEKYGEDIHNVTVVFPNKRASLFLNNELAMQASKPIWSPQYVTISELFQQDTTLQLADRIKLVFELHKSYVKVTKSSESLESFYGWGELMLSDFDDIDKHLADAKRIFTLLGDIHELDDYDYLTETQKEALEHFFKNFHADHTTELKQRFLTLWSKFYDIYADFQERLLSQNIAYEGMLYRDAYNRHSKKIPKQLRSNSGGIAKNCNSQSELSPATPYIFIGFNYLTTVEESMIANYVSETNGKVYVDNEKCPPKELSFVSSPTDDLQARYVMQWLTPERIKAGRKTAIVLADEGLLDTVLHCLPENITLNITTGYPLAQAPVSSLIKLLSKLLTNAKSTYTLHDINAILRHPLTKFISPEVDNLHKKLNEDLIYYLKPEELFLDDNLRQFFMPLQDATNVTELIDRLLWLTKTIATSLHTVEGQGDALTSESLYRMYTLLNRLRGLVDSNTSAGISLFSKLLQQIIQSTTIPFHGEPIEGIQVMGVLETRNLDFDHVLLLSCNEGKMPAKINDSSFLPHAIRMGYNLTTVENKVSIYENYFDRLLQRAKDVTIVYNNATTDGKTGEMSRFMLQLMAEGSRCETQETKKETPYTINLYSLEADMQVPLHESKVIEKSPQMVNILLRKRYLSPSALGVYMRCPLRFYYQHVVGIRDDGSTDEEEMDNMTFGLIFHSAAQDLYKGFEGSIVPRNFINTLLKEKGHPTLRRIVEKAFRQELFNIPEDSSRETPKLSGLQVINFEMVVNFLLHLLRYDLSLTRLEIQALEKDVQDEIVINLNGTERLVKIGGMIDRLDIVTDIDGVRRMRVIDYKTGRLSKKLAVNNISEIFTRESRDGEGAKMTDHADYFLQALLYSYIINKQENKATEISSGLLYVQQATAEGYDPLLNIAGEPLLDAKPYLTDFQQELASLISEILNTEIPFRPTSDSSKCDTCPFYNFCH